MQAGKHATTDSEPNADNHSLDAMDASLFIWQWWAEQSAFLG